MAGIAALSVAAPATAQIVEEADQLAPMIEAFRQGWKQTEEPIRMGIPLHGGVLEFAMPHNFVPALRVQGEGQFMMAFIPDGEDWSTFSEAVIVQSSAALGGAPHSTAELAEAVFKPRVCIGEPLWEALGERDVGSAVPAFLAATGCTSLVDIPEQGQQSFLALVRGSPDAAAIIYARRSPAFDADAPPVSAEGARQQIAKFGDIKLCRSAEQEGCRDVWLREELRRRGGR